jgi:SagB-type dehydrogenase family enzyme
VALVLLLQGIETDGHAQEHKMETIKLPEPRLTSNTSIEEALLKRRSIRTYKDVPASVAELSQILWAGQGITDRRGLRTAPSAGALYPLEIYVIAGNVRDLPAGVYQYRPNNHELARIVSGDKRSELSSAALGQRPIKTAAAVIVISAVYERTTGKYGERGIRYADMEAGHAAQNITLQAVALNLGSVMVGAFEDNEVKKIMQMAEREQPLYIIPVGRK